MTTSTTTRRLSRRVLIVVVLHLVVFTLTYWLAFAIRADFQITNQEWKIFAVTLPGVILVKTAVFYWLGHCHGWWRYVTFSDLSVLLRAATLSVVAIAAIDYFNVSEVARTNQIQVPRTILILDWGLTVMVLGGLRCVWRLSREEFMPMLFRNEYQRAFIVGANQAGESLARILQADPRLKYSIAGFLDADPAKQGMQLGGIPVVGPPLAAPRVAAAFGVRDVLVVSDILAGKELRQLMDECAKADLQLKVLPGVEEMLQADYHVRVRDIDINDLLRREPVDLDAEEIEAMINGGTVMVTGAGGSIGSEICRQVLRFHPKQLVMVERSENNLFLIEQELRHVTSHAHVVPAIGDVGDADRMEQIFEAHRPDVVFHAAAHKHVPMMEYNPCEAIKNNVLGTKQVVDLADRFEAKHFVLISTDKAVNPTSIMGTSKQLAERYVHAFSERSSTKFVVVRFGNVLASAGSVVPIFKEQIRNGGPVTVTHPEIERYFMTIPEASRLVLQAAAMCKGGEIFVLDMGEPVKIVDLARDLIRLSGFRNDEIEVKFTGLRPGEKLYEELYFDNEEMLSTPHPKVFVAYHRAFALDDIQGVIDELIPMLSGSEADLRKKLKEVVPEYSGDESEPAQPAPRLHVADDPDAASERQAG